VKKKILKGYCQCGCGKRTKIALASSTQWGYVKGQPRRFIHGHYLRPREPLLGGRVRNGDYILVSIGLHPRSDRGYVKEHILKNVGV
jgi:hypothetical protein